MSDLQYTLKHSLFKVCHCCKESIDGIFECVILKQGDGVTPLSQSIVQAIPIQPSSSSSSSSSSSNGLNFNVIVAHPGDCIAYVRDVILTHQTKDEEVRIEKRARSIIHPGECGLLEGAYPTLKRMMQSYLSVGINVASIGLSTAAASNSYHSLGYRIQFTPDDFTKAYVLPNKDFSQTFGNKIWSPVLLFTSYGIIPIKVTLKTSNTCFSLNSQTILNRLRAMISKRKVNTSTIVYITGSFPVGIDDEDVHNESTFTLYIVVLYVNNDKLKDLRIDTKWMSIEDNSDNLRIMIASQMKEMIKLIDERLIAFDDGAWDITLTVDKANTVISNMIDIECHHDDELVSVYCNATKPDMKLYPILVKRAALVPIHTALQLPTNLLKQSRQSSSSSSSSSSQETQIPEEFQDLAVAVIEGKKTESFTMSIGENIESIELIRARCVNISFMSIKG